MKRIKFEQAKARIVILYKELIKKYTALGYKFDIIELSTLNQSNHIFYHLRFTKAEADCKYYKVMIDVEKFTRLKLSFKEEIIS
ncbi:MAG TPA: hypothetical protein ENG87_02000 [Candidatus Pacearchaeota archaeon]|nr:hypothetical protein BMS3Abin04_01407 [bacterium BMS3Abin04]HDK42126.1 hypothetical protein [Candidatus Pacearchaeota archaeon]